MSLQGDYRLNDESMTNDEKDACHSERSREWSGWEAATWTGRPQAERTGSERNQIPLQNRRAISRDLSTSVCFAPDAELIIRVSSLIRRSTFVLRHFHAGFLALTWLVTSSDTFAASKPERPEHTNRLAQEKSPYLLQHAHNPVDWYPWGEEAFAKARRESKPIFLSVGYSTCHWCHVMAHESFEDEGIAKIVNDHFIAIKVDREERPDIDHIYMTAVTSMTGQGGWPLTVFLTPQGEPF